MSLAFHCSPLSRTLLSAIVINVLLLRMDICLQFSYSLFEKGVEGLSDPQSSLFNLMGRDNLLLTPLVPPFCPFISPLSRTFDELIVGANSQHPADAQI